MFNSYTNLNFIYNYIDINWNTFQFPFIVKKRKLYFYGIIEFNLIINFIITYNT